MFGEKSIRDSGTLTGLCWLCQRESLLAALSTHVPTRQIIQGFTHPCTRACTKTCVVTWLQIEQ